MSRAFTRALALTTIGGLAVAPSLAYAASDTSVQHAQTVTRVLAPKHAQGNADVLLSARVSLVRKAAPTQQELEADRKGAKGGKGTAKRHKGGKAGTGRGHRQASETGSVIFTVDGKKLAPVRVSHGRALEKLELTPGSHTATASYSGDDNYSPSESAPVTFTVS